MKLMKKQTTKSKCTPKQLKMPIEVERLIDMEDPVYSFSEVVDRIDLRKYFVEKESKVGRSRYDGVKKLKIILFALMENGYASVRKMSKLCKTDIRYMWLLDGMKAPSFMKISQFIQGELTESCCVLLNFIAFA